MSVKKDVYRIFKLIANFNQVLMLIDIMYSEFMFIFVGGAPCKNEGEAFLLCPNN